MRKVERQTSSKYAKRIARENARGILQELFDFLRKGSPPDWDPIAEPELKETQKSFTAILNSGLAAQQPDEASLATWNRCLNIPERIEPYYFGKFLHGSKRTPVLRFAFVTPSYLKRAADLLKRFLTEFRNELLITGRNSLMASCPICETVFLKSTLRQVCCSRQCGNRYDYRMRTSTDEGKQKHRNKSESEYWKNWKKRTARRAAKAAEKRAAMLGARRKRILELCGLLGGLLKVAGTYRREREILKAIEREGFSVSDLSGNAIRRMWKESLKATKTVLKST